MAARREVERLPNSQLRDVHVPLADVGHRPLQHKLVKRSAVERQLFCCRLRGSPI
jgi:hypothetical protein